MEERSSGKILEGATLSRGFGFIKPFDGGENIYFHVNASDPTPDPPERAYEQAPRVSLTNCFCVCRCALRCFLRRAHRHLPAMLPDSSSVAFDTSHLSNPAS
jgi:hypothetical protein